MRFLIFICAALLPLLAHASGLQEYGCGLMYKKAGSDKIQYVQTPDFHMTDYNDKDQLVKFMPPDGMKIIAILCTRSFLIPYKYDYMAIRAGYLLYIKAEDRIFVLERQGGKFRYRLVQGKPPTESEKTKINTMLQYFDLHQGDK